MVNQNKNHEDKDNSKDYSSNVWTVSTLKCRNALAFGFKTTTHLCMSTYIFRNCNTIAMCKKSNWQNTA